MVLDKQLAEVYRHHYNRADIQEAFKWLLRWRETVAFSSDIKHRYLQAYSFNGIKLMTKFLWELNGARLSYQQTPQRAWNMFLSCDYLWTNRIDQPSFFLHDDNRTPNGMRSLAHEWKVYQESFAARRDKLRFGFDIVLDIDFKKYSTLERNIRKAQKDATKVAEYLNSLQVPYNLKFSGSKGFHFVIRWGLESEKDRLIRSCWSPEDFPGVMGIVREHIAAKTKIKTLDPSVGLPTQIFRLPYSIHTSTNLVARPLTFSQLDTFTLEDFEPGNLPVLPSKGYALPRVLLLEQNQGGSVKNLKKVL